MTNQILSLQLRKLYGGMNGDMVMIDQYSLVWLKREKDHSTELKTPVLNEYNTPFRLTTENFVLEAIDFHPCPWIIGDLKRDSNLGFDETRKSIWHNYSSVNYRIEQTVEDCPVYRDKWMELARGILSKYLK
jgi:hypothetical protein